MTEKRITIATADEQIKQLYETAFPEDEQIPWDDLMRLVGEMPLDFTAYYDGQDFIGFTVVYPRKSFNWFCTLPCVRNYEAKAMASIFSPS